MPPEQPLAMANRASESQGTVAQMQLTLEAWADVLNSPLSIAAERIETLTSIERALVQYTRPSVSKLVALDPATTFWNLQGVSGFNLAETLLGLLYRLHLELIAQEQLLENEHLTEQQCQTAQQTITQACMSLTILQGVTLCSTATKRIMQRKSSLELLLQITLADYCTRLLPSALSPPSTPVTPTFSSADSPLSLPSGFALDLLMCVLVDSNVSQERFADMGGLQQIIQLSHKCADAVTSTVPASAATISALKQTDLLCLEFRYFWTQLLKTASSSSSSSTSLSLSQVQSNKADQHDKSESRFDSPPGTPKASTRNTNSPPLDSDPSSPQLADTPKANRRRVTAPLASASDCAPTQTKVAESLAQPAPRRLRQSTSTVELRRRATASSLDTVPPLPKADLVRTNIATEVEKSATPSSSTTLQSARRTLQHRQSIASFRSSDFATHPSHQSSSESTKASAASASAPLAAQILPRNPPGMSSRDRPRIPSPLKPRASLQCLTSSTPPLITSSSSSRKSLDPSAEMSSSSISSHRRPRASIASSSLTSISAASSPSPSPFSSTFSRDARSKRMDEFVEDIENRHPSQRYSPTENIRHRKSSSPPALHALTESPKQSLSPSYSAQNIPPVLSRHIGESSPLKTSRSSGMLRSSTTSAFTPVKKTRPEGTTSLGLGLNVGLISSSSSGKGARIPPSPAVRRAQLARAKSFSPTKPALSSTSNESSDMYIPTVPSIPSFHLAASEL